VCSKKLWFNVASDKKRYEKQAGPTARNDWEALRPLCMEHEFGWALYQMSSPAVALGIADTDERNDRFDEYLDANMGERAIPK